jgi:DNA-binding IclR family transcriptional regulator
MRREKKSKSAAVAGARAPGKPKTEQRYRAPALDKGLDILELLSGERQPMSVSLISQRLGRSMNELFRMIQVLEYRGFIEQADSGAGYRATRKLFSLGMEHAPVKNLLEIALPVMRELAQRIAQSCHLAVRTLSDIVVVARMESDAQIGFSVRVGHRRPIVLTSSGVVLYAFQPPEIQKEWEASFGKDATEEQLIEFRARALRVAKQGYERRPSEFVDGVVDLSVPIMRGKRATAALTIPFVRSKQLQCSVEESVRLLTIAANDISSSLHDGDEHI